MKLSSPLSFSDLLPLIKATTKFSHTLTTLSLWIEGFKLVLCPKIWRLSTSIGFLLTSLSHKVNSISLNSLEFRVGSAPSYSLILLLLGISTMGKASSPVSISILFLIGALLSREFDSRVLLGASTNWFSLGKNRSLLNTCIRQTCSYNNSNFDL